MTTLADMCVSIALCVGAVVAIVTAIFVGASMTYAAFATTGYTDDDCGFSGAFGWYRTTEKPTMWFVFGYEKSFSESGYATTDDFGNLVRVEI